MLRFPPMIEDAITGDSDRTRHRYGERMTIDEWADLEREERGELVNGVLVEEEMVDPRHDILMMYLGRVVGTWAASMGGRVFSPEVKYRLREDLGRKPDMSLFVSGKKPPPTGAIPVTPDAMVEIISPTPRDARRDRIEKLSEYAAFGVRHYWLVDIELRTLEVLELDEEGRYVHVLAASSGTHPIPGCAGLELNLDELWGELDWLEQSPT